MTFNATLDILVTKGCLVPYEPRLRFDQMPERLVYLRGECRDQLEGLEDGPGGENPDPVPREQIKGLFDRICVGRTLEADHDFEQRGKKLFVLKTRSVRAGAIFLSETVLVVLDVQPKAAFKPEKSGPWTSARWYDFCRALPEFTALSQFASKDAPWDENANH